MDFEIWGVVVSVVRVLSASKSKHAPTTARAIRVKR
jgi:hypothetical protein